MKQELGACFLSTRIYVLYNIHKESRCIPWQGDMYMILGVELTML